MRSKKIFTLAGIGVGIAVVAALAWFFLARTGKMTSESESEAKAPPSGNDAVPAGPPSQSRETETAGGRSDPSAMPVAGTGADAAPGTSSGKDPGVGPAQGTTPDPRVRNTADGKTILTIPFDLSRRLHSPETAPREDLDILDEILRYYRKVYGENPVVHGNREVVASLSGANPRNLVMFDPDHPDRNGDGELLDRYGNPYYFHAVSRTVTDIVSAGPDGERGTTDDMHSNPGAGEKLQLHAKPALD